MPLLARRLLVGLCLGAPWVLLGPSVRADHDHDSARRAVEHGEALPLSEILDRVRPQLGGEVVGVSFEREHGRWVYEFRIIGPAGLLTEVSVDAATARIVKRESD